LLPPWSYHRAGLDPTRESDTNPMTRTSYLAALRRLELKPHSKRTAAALGVSMRSLAYYAKGILPVPEPVARLLKLMLQMQAGHAPDPR
jgi:hypothetical protein